MLINKLLASIFVVVNRIVLNKSNSLMLIVYLIVHEYFDELKEVKYFKDMTDFKKK